MSMKAVNYQGPFKVTVEDVPRPKIEHPDDVQVCQLFSVLHRS